MKQIVFSNIFIGIASLSLCQTSSDTFFDSCNSKKSNAEICQCMTSKKETLKNSLITEFDSLIKLAKEISNERKDNVELSTILRKHIELLSTLKNSMIQTALKVGELKASSSEIGSGYTCFLAEEQFHELNKIIVFLEERKQELISFKEW